MVVISPINLTNIFKVSQNNHPQQRISMAGIPNDEFVRSTPVDETPVENKEDVNEFTKWADKTQFVLKELPSILMNPEAHTLGTGFSHTTYEIPDNNDYILRAPNGFTYSDVDYCRTQIRDVMDRNLKINVGQPVAELELRTHNNIPMFLEVLRKQEGESVGVPPASTIYDEETGMIRDGVLPYEAPERKAKYAQSLSKLANLPVETYEKLISDIKAAADAGYIFDHLNSNNLLLDEKNNSINIIDMDKGKMKPDFGNVLYALTNISYFKTYASGNGGEKMNPDDVQKAIDNTIAITQKFIMAMGKQNVKFNGPNSSMEFYNLLHSYPMAWMVQSYDAAKVYELFVSNGVG